MDNYISLQRVDRFLNNLEDLLTEINQIDEYQIDFKGWCCGSCGFDSINDPGNCCLYATTSCQHNEVRTLTNLERPAYVSYVGRIRDDNTEEYHEGKLNRLSEKHGLKVKVDFNHDYDMICVEITNIDNSITVPSLQVMAMRVLDLNGLVDKIPEDIQNLDFFDLVMDEYLEFGHDKEELSEQAYMLEENY